MQGNGQSIANGSTAPTTTDDTDFGSTNVTGGTVVHTFTISNTGTADLLLTNSPAVTLTNGAHFNISAIPGATTIISNTATTFDVTFDPSAAGSFTDTVNIANNDSNENPYTFVISGTGTISAPIVTTDAATAVSSSGATLNGTVNANGDSTVVTFEYGTTTSYGTTVNAGQSPVTGSSNTAVSKAITGLTANTAYHYRAVGVNGGGAANGVDMTFTTSAAAAPEMDMRGNGQSIADGDTTPATADDTDFGSANVSGGTVVRTFTISNTGTADLLLTDSPAVTLTNGAHFNISAIPGATTIISNTATTFNVTFDPAAAGSFTDTVNIANNDSNENPYTFVISGTGTAVPTATPTPASTPVPPTATPTSTPTPPTALSADLAISKTLQVYSLSTITFTLTARNLGPDAANGAVVSDTLPANVTGAAWTCAATGGATCGAASGSGDLMDTLGAFPSGGVVTYTVGGTVTDWGHVLNTAEVIAPDGVNDAVPSNNRTTIERWQTLMILIFKNYAP